MKFQSILGNIANAAIVSVVVLLAFSNAAARPDFDVHPRTIEVGLTNNNFPVRDTLRIDNASGNDADTVLVWTVTVEPEDHDWLTLSREEGEVGVDRNQRVVVTMMGRDAPDDHNFVNLIFHSNDPTRLEYTVPVAGHKVAFPRITTNWAQPQWGGWWGIDLNLIFGEIFYGDTCSIRLNIRNPGSAELVVDAIQTSNGYWSIVPSSFNLAANGNRSVDFVFYALETGANATVITSLSNAWDPNELNFRIIAGVNPVFRLVRHIPDTTLYEDDPEWLVADVDTLYLSSDRGLTYRVNAPNLHSRIERNGNFYLAPNADWYGESQVILSACNTRGETLSDTFRVLVLPVQDPPAAFDLLAPADGAVIRWDAPDTMFTWEASRDADGDTVRYKLTLSLDNGESVKFCDLLETSFPVRSLSQLIDLDSGGAFHWTVQATDGIHWRDANSVFHNSVVPLSVPEPAAPVADDFHLLQMYPNPFNSILRLSFQTLADGRGAVSVSDGQGHLIETIYRGDFSAGRHNFVWQPQNLPSGTYFISIDISGKTLKQPVTYMK